MLRYQPVYHAHLTCVFLLLLLMLLLLMLLLMLLLVLSWRCTLRQRINCC
jgi:hypothetical protein